MSKIKTRFAVPEDIDAILHFVHLLAAYEHMEDQVEATPEMYRREIFENNRAEVLLALDEADAPVGMALFFHSFSTWQGRHGIYLEDLFVLPDRRGRGYGKALLRRLAQLTLERGGGRLEWSCLDWNRPSIEFYLSLGAEAQDEWTRYRLSGGALKALAEA